MVLAAYYPVETDSPEQRQRAAAAQRRTEQRIRVAVESAHVGVWEFLPRSCKIYWNARSAALHGLPQSRFVVAEEFFTLLEESDRELVRMQAQSALDPDGTGEIDLEYRVPAGREMRWIAVQGRVFFETINGVRRPVRATGTMLDVTSRKCADAEREELLSELQRSNRELARYSHVVSHDLQSPLRAIRSFTQLLSRRCESALDSAAHEYIKNILGGADAMQELIDGLLKYAQLGAPAPERQCVSLRETMATVQTLLHEEIESTGAAVACEPLPDVQGDAVQLRQLFQNLLGNALKYRQRETRPQISVRVREYPTKWLFAVEDNGLGIEPEHADLVFQPMQRLHGAEIPGSGIGLAVCRQIVEQHGGEIWVESLPGKGSTFRFTLARPR